MGGLTAASLAACRARFAEIARRSAVTPHDRQLGEITLRQHQVDALQRVGTLLDLHGGCLLADEVGQGKTFVALAAARRWRQVVVVVPASLRETWRYAMRRAGVAHPLVSHEALSRGYGERLGADGVIVDESHRFRNPGTRRYAALADGFPRAELLLLSATPLQNRLGDLEAQLALFLGTAARGLGDAALARHVVRVPAPPDVLPVVSPAEWVLVPADDAEVLHTLLALPPPPRGVGMGDAGALRALSLVRAWASSRAALTATLARRRRIAVGIEQSLAAGRVPTRGELRAWQVPESGDVQLGFAALLAAHPAGPGMAELQGAVSAELEALDALRSALRRCADPDVARGSVLRAIARHHGEDRIIAFTELASTARAYHASLRDEPGAALLTASGGRIASGRLSRGEVIARFAPRAHGLPEPPARERVRLLVSTDLLAEGVNLQDASVVVHLDLPWNPARMAQRVGRVRRPDGAPLVTTYIIAPPAASEPLLAVQARLREKLAATERIIGRGIAVLPQLAAPASLAPTHSAALRGEVYARVAAWGAGDGVHDGILTACAHSSAPGWLAVLRDGTLIAARGDAAGDDGALLDWATRAAECNSCCGSRCERGRHAVASARAWSQRHLVLESCGAQVGRCGAAREAERLIASALGRAPRHERPRVAAVALGLRRALSAPMSLGAERALERLMARATDGDAGWLEEALPLVDRQRPITASPPGSGDVVAVIALHP